MKKYTLYCGLNAGIFVKGAAATAGSTSMKRRMKTHADLPGLRRDL